MGFREEGCANERLAYDEEHNLFRFKYDGVFAFSREHANAFLHHAFDPVH